MGFEDKAMPLRDYSEDEDFYTQDFERRGQVSVWLGTTPAAAQSGIDTLQDLCGVGYYRLSDQECSSSLTPVPVAQLFEGTSYADSFLPAVLSAAQRHGVAAACRMTAQFDFAYDPSRVRRPVASQPVFVGVFEYSAD